jgi:hypothetical protein
MIREDTPCTAIMGFVDDLQTAFKPSGVVRMGGQASKTLCGDAAAPLPAAERGPEHAQAERGWLRYRRLCSNYFRSLKCLLHCYGASTSYKNKSASARSFLVVLQAMPPPSPSQLLCCLRNFAHHSQENTRKIPPTESTFSSGSDRTAALEERQVSRNL